MVSVISSANSATQEIDNGFDDLMSILDMSDGVMTPEEAFLHEYSIGQFPKLHNIAFHLRNVLANFEYYKNSGYKITKSSIVNGVPQNVPVTRKEAASCMIESFIWSNLRHRVDKSLGLEKSTICEIDKLVKIILEAPDEYLQKIIRGD